VNELHERNLRVLQALARVLAFKVAWSAWKQVEEHAIAAQDFGDGKGEDQHAVICWSPSYIQTLGLTVAAACNQGAPTDG
jgi:hypothetical protein